MEPAPLTYTGTLRSADCTRRGPQLGRHGKNWLCGACATVFTSDAFWHSMRRAGERKQTSKGNDQYLTAAALRAKIRRLRARVKAVRRAARDQRQNFARMAMRQAQATPAERIVDLCARGDIDAAVSTARTSTYGATRRASMEMVANVLTNLQARSAQGHRHNDATSAVYMAVSIWAGPKVRRFLADNMLGPSARTVERWKQEFQAHLEPGLTATNFKRVAAIYQKAKTELKLTGDVPVEIVEDETSHAAKMCWDPRTDLLLGACGLQCALN